MIDRDVGIGIAVRHHGDGLRQLTGTGHQPLDGNEQTKPADFPAGNTSQVQPGSARNQRHSAWTRRGSLMRIPTTASETSNLLAISEIERVPSRKYDRTNGAGINIVAA